MPEAPTMSVERASEESPEVQALAERLTAFLAANEAENNLPLSIVADVRGGRYERFELLLAADADGRSRSALVWTKPFNLLLCYGDDAGAREKLLETLLAAGEVPPGVTGPEPAAGRVAAWLAEQVGATAKRAMRQGIYRLTKVLPGRRPEGTVRLARPEEGDVFGPWLE